jgi:hypothetical protein
MLEASDMRLIFVTDGLMGKTLLKTTWRCRCAAFFHKGSLASSPLVRKWAPYSGALNAKI